MLCTFSKRLGFLSQGILESSPQKYRLSGPIVKECTIRFIHYRNDFHIFEKMNQPDMTNGHSVRTVCNKKRNGGFHKVGKIQATCP